ncbi:MAG: GNAT family N-acetyltransferase [Lachnospiraceae bacterium]
MIIVNVEVKMAKQDDWNEAILLAKHTFCTCNYKDCTLEGAKHFLMGLENPRLYQAFLQGYYLMIGAYVQQQLVGMITIRNDNHISLFFVKPSIQEQGVGLLLLQAAIRYCQGKGHNIVCVNASRLAVPFYEKNGFYTIQQEYLDDGVYITPMRCELA